MKVDACPVYEHATLPINDPREQVADRGRCLPSRNITPEFRDTLAVTHERKLKSWAARGDLALDERGGLVVQDFDPCLRVHYARAFHE
jgi:hypothetical protein